VYPNQLVLALLEFDDSGRDDDGNVADGGASSGGQESNGSSRTKHRKEIIKKVDVLEVLFVLQYAKFTCL
jgi:hypothetical protein